MFGCLSVAGMTVKHAVHDLMQQHESDQADYPNGLGVVITQPSTTTTTNGPHHHSQSSPPPQLVRDEPCSERVDCVWSTAEQD